MGLLDVSRRKLTGKIFSRSGIFRKLSGDHFPLSVKIPRSGKKFVLGADDRLWLKPKEASVVLLQENPPLADTATKRSQ